MEAMSTGGYNRAAVLAAALQPGPCTRSTIESRTGLSKATVSRWVDALIDEGVLVAGAELHREGRGRKSLYLEPGTRLGCVVGVDLGLTGTRLYCTDLRGTRLAQHKFDTPTGLSRLALVRRLVSEIHALVAATPYADRLAGSVIAVAAGVRDDREIIRPAREFDYLTGTKLGETLARHLKVPVLVDADANMALRGEMTDGCAFGVGDAALFTISTRFRAAFARAGHIMYSPRSMVGELEWLPMPSALAGSTLGDVLSAHTALAAAARLQGSAVTIGELADTPASSPLAQLVSDFTDGVVLAVSVAALTVDPDVVVFNGRMLPVIARVMPHVNERLVALLPTVPDLRMVDSDGFSGARGAAITAMDQAVTRVVDAARVHATTDVG